MSRLLTLLLLYHGDYEVGRFISREELIDQTKESYYDALRASTANWSDGTHDLAPWLSYFLGISVAAYSQFEERIALVAGGRGAKAEANRRTDGPRLTGEPSLDFVGDPSRSSLDAGRSEVDDPKQATPA